MDFDDVVVGSGLSALATVLGLPAHRRVLVLGGPQVGAIGHYDASQSVPSFHHGRGGLGSYWHGVIPTGLVPDFTRAGRDRFASLFGRFYPRTAVAERLGEPWLFIPWRPIRPNAHFTALARQRASRLVLRDEPMQSFAVGDAGVQVRSASGSWRAGRLWVGAGALHTPALLEASFGRKVSRGLVSDHVIAYLGQVRGAPAPRIERTSDGFFVEASHADGGNMLCTLRPARFAFARLDQGIETRAAFGLPTTHALGKIVRKFSPGLFAEALYTRAGLFGAAPVHSVYAQIAVPDAYALDAESARLTGRAHALAGQIERAREQASKPGLMLSRRPDYFIPAIHLHHSLELDALAALGVNTPDGPVQVVDASAHEKIGGEHHSFKVMVAAHARAASMT